MIGRVDLAYTGEHHLHTNGIEQALRFHWKRHDDEWIEVAHMARVSIVASAWRRDLVAPLRLSTAATSSVEPTLDQFELATWQAAQFC